MVESWELRWAVGRNVLASEGSVFYACGGRIPLGGTGADGPSAHSSAASPLSAGSTGGDLGDTLGLR